MVKINIQEMFKGLDPDWIKVLMSPKIMCNLKNVITALSKETKMITPKPRDIFNFARYSKYKEVKIVIIGHGPCPTLGEANGLAFSCNKLQGPVHSIYKCIKKNKLIDEMPVSGDLTYWAEQGVLLLNTALTTVVNKTGTHKKIWDGFTNALIKHISHDKNCGQVSSLIFFLWGEHAISKKSYINNDCFIMEWQCPPSPTYQESIKHEDKFEKCDHFINANKFLDSEGISPIDWNLQSTALIYTDGACSGNGKRIAAYAGYSVYFSTGPQRNVVKYCKLMPSVFNGEMIYPSNQRAEGLAICVALEMSKAKQNTIVTDSQFWINMAQDWMPSWDRKGIDFNTKKNPDITKRMWNLIKDTNVTFIHVESHGKNKNANPEHMRGNSIADKFAVKAKNLDDYRERETIIQNFGIEGNDDGD